MPIDIKYVTVADADTLSDIAPEVFDHPLDPAQLEAFLADSRHILVLALADRTVVGMASAVEYFHPDKQPQLWINEVGVTPSRRRQGIGRQLVRELLAIARERGCVYAWLGTGVENAAGQACFSAVSENHEREPFLLYEWELEQ